MGTQIKWVKAHQMSNDIEARHNQLADKLANLGRAEAENLPPLCQYIAKDLSPLVITLENFKYKGQGQRIVADGIRKQLQEISLEHAVYKWKQLKRQGHIINKHTEETLLTARMIRKNGTSQMLAFFLLAVCDWLPAYNNISFKEHGKFCPH